MTDEGPPEGDATAPKPLRFSSEDAARALSPDAGWAPTLTREQQDELLALVRPTLDEHGKHRFRSFVNLIFADAVERYTIFDDPARGTR